MIVTDAKPIDIAPKRRVLYATVHVKMYRYIFWKQQNLSDI